MEIAMPSESGQPTSAAATNENVVRIPEDALIIVPVRSMVLFPGVVAPITIARPKSIAAAQQALREQRPIGVLLQRNAELNDPGPDDLYRICTIANIVRYITAPDESHHVVCQGVQRARILDFLPGTPFLAARVLQIPEPANTSPEIEARFLNLQRQAIEAIQLLPQAPPELIAAFQSTSSPAALADLATSYMDIKPQDKQEILETIDLSRRMEKVSAHLPNGWKSCGSPTRSGRKRKPPSTSANARRSCASKWRPSSVSSAKPTVGRPRSPNSPRPSQGRRCRLKRRARRARSCAVTNACRRPPQKPGWCALIWIG
jgi:ATP-dependent Lon protease